MTTAEARVFAEEVRGLRAKFGSAGCAMRLAEILVHLSQVDDNFDAIRARAHALEAKRKVHDLREWLGMDELVEDLRTATQG